MIALVLVSLASVLGLSLIEHAQNTIGRSQAMVNRAKADQLSQGMAILSKRTLEDILALDERQKMAINIYEWTPPYQIEGGWIQGRLIEVSHRFNLNALFHPEASTRAHARTVFQNLLQSLNIDLRRSEIWFDWLAGDGGVSQSEAQQRFPLIHVSELREWPGMDTNTYLALMPWVSVLPTPELKININQTTPTILASAVYGLDTVQAERLLMGRPFMRLADVWAHPVMQNIEMSSEERATWTLKPLHYLGQSRVTLGDEEGPVVYDTFRLISPMGSGYDFRYVSQGTP